MSPPSRTKTCDSAVGRLAPVVDRARCEGKGACAEVCPYEVFRVSRMADGEFAALPVLAKLKAIAHRRQTAYTPGAEQCRACGLCVEACPEKAIKLVASARHH